MKHETQRISSRRAKPPWLAALGLLLLCTIEARAQGSIEFGSTNNGGATQEGGFGALYSSIGEPITTDSLGASDETTWDGFWQVLPTNIPSSVDEEMLSGATDVTAIARAYPSPFATQTTIDVQLARPGDVRLSVYDMLGREVTTLVEGRREAGSIRVHWRPERLESGNYFIRLELDGQMYGALHVQYYR